MPSEMSRLAQYQAAFAARIRDPRRAALPAGASARRMRVYQELLFNNLESFLLACYPVSRRILGKRRWQKMVRHFFAEHRSHSPLFRDIPEAFLHWARTRAEMVNEDWPFLTDLLEYEWLELAVSIDPRVPGSDTVDPAGDLLAGIPVLQPASRLASYRWAVHRLGPRFRPRDPDGTVYHYLLFRGEDDSVRFLLLNPLSAALLALAQLHPASGHQLLTQLADHGGMSDRDAFIRQGATLLGQLRQQGAIVGVRSTT
ncbi:MAG TPA: putative DNA-binding domain-containing protein [Rhodocyclaceae bacterium]|nr:putative DNA-binding domain-containing protein [Rhodocyclaceae bacterium]